MLRDNPKIAKDVLSYKYIRKTAQGTYRLDFTQAEKDAGTYKPRSPRKSPGEALAATITQRMKRISVVEMGVFIKALPAGTKRRLLHALTKMDKSGKKG